MIACSGDDSFVDADELQEEIVTGDTTGSGGSGGSGGSAGVGGSGSASSGDRDREIGASVPALPVELLTQNAPPITANMAAVFLIMSSTMLVCGFYSIRLAALVSATFASGCYGAAGPMVGIALPSGRATAGGEVSVATFTFAHSVAFGEWSFPDFPDRWLV
jgi:hypothetical protein